MTAKALATLERVHKGPYPVGPCLAPRRSLTGLPLPTRAVRGVAHGRRYSFTARLRSTLTDRVVLCESLLEARCAKIAEVDPQIMDVEEQVLRLETADGVHVPDFRFTLRSGLRVLGLVKPRGRGDAIDFGSTVEAVVESLTPDVADRAIWLDEEKILAEPRLANAERIRLARRCQPSIEARSAVLDHARASSAPIRLSDLPARLASPDAWDAALVLVGEGLLRPCRPTPALDDDALLTRASPDGPASPSVGFDLEALR